MSSVKTKISNC